MARYQPELEGTTLKTLAELRPRIGERVRLETRSPRGRHLVQLVGFRENASVIVSAPRNSGTPVLINEGAMLTVRLMAGNWVCAFETRLIRIQNHPYPYWHLAWPQQIDAQRVRHHTRVPVNLRVSVDPDDGGHPTADFPVSACCTDIHVAGACLEANRVLGRTGDKIFITARLSVSGIDHVLLAPAIIRSIYESEGGSFSVISHGVEFVDLEEETHLILAGFVYQQYLVETGYLAQEDTQ
ncbi:flagellar brake protein [Marinobacterium mangrovicola]|uniref:PilZ domain-containing protein n=1 Tax=Marinobacterium mangrovicola TaxID=1476959 RepID=A0A4R1G797_9GAMM|nr:flagellar brake protein [Marinobacterium mangrovicola]TCK02541.1 PilZ domain-containing protein [Marinobacterium mangrovicola]